MAAHAKLIYRGGAMAVPVFVSLLEDEGLTVSWRLPVEERSAGEVATSIVEMTVSGLLVSTVQAGVKAAIRRFKTRPAAGHSEIEVVSDSDTDAPDTDE